jgi:hypothetical protein
MEIIESIILGLSGLLLGFVGFMRMINPIETYAKNSGINIQNDANLLNEIRGVGSLMLVAGIIVLLGTVISEITKFSSVVASLIFLGFLVGRAFSILTDGKPNKQLIIGFFSELIFGVANMAFLFL